MYFLNLLIVAVSINLTGGPRWVENLDDAKALARQEEKLILLLFSGSDWCRNCILLDHEVVSSTEFNQLAEHHLILLKADFPRKRKNQLPEGQQSLNQSLAAKFNPEGEFPKAILLDANENILLESGYGQGQKQLFLKHLEAKVHHE